MTDPWILYTEQMDKVDGWFFEADVELFSNLLACQTAENIRGNCWRSAHMRASPPS